MDNFTLEASDGLSVACYAWPIETPTLAVVIAHGMGEHAQRYDRLAAQLNEAGCYVTAKDHRGHGDTAAGQFGFMGEDGWNRCISDTLQLVEHTRAQCPDVPLVLLGHSMGSMLTQQYITRHGDSVDAVVLSGSPGFKPRLAGYISRMIAWVEKTRLGPDAHSDLMQEKLFGEANSNFEGDTGYEWLSRDEAEVAKYVDDSACGFVLSAGSLLDLFRGSAESSSKKAVDSIPKSLPLYVFAGAQDPVHSEKQDIQRMLHKYFAAGIHRIDVKYYPEGRHEMFNELNRDEVTNDLVEWLNGLSVQTHG